MRLINRVTCTLFAAALALLPAAPLRAQMPAPPVSSEKLLHVGGYAGVVMGAAPATATQNIEVSQSVVAALLSGTLIPRLTYFAELEAASRSRENWTGDSEHDAFDVERLYAEVTVADALRIRAGRFLTPVGQWNEDHADPLTWTPQRPLTTYRPFAKSTTGLLIAGQFSIAGRDAGYALYGTPRRIESEREEAVFSHALGGRLAMEVVPGMTIGASFTEFRASRPVVTDDDQEHETEVEDGDTIPEEPEVEDRVEDTATRRLFGADLRLEARWLSIHAEATTLSATADRPRERGAFVQTAIPLFLGISAVGRVEYYDPVVSSTLRVGTAGLTYRPVPRVAIKVAHQWTSRVSRRAPAGWFVSLSGLL
ncbi:MAG TPA: hypothetical protein VF021_04890 [Longimicrobiales bacterium]